MKKALGKVIVAFLFCLLSFGVVSPSHAMADNYYCDLQQQPECVETLWLSGDKLNVNIPPSGVNSIDVTFSNYSFEYDAVVDNNNDYIEVVIPPSNSERRMYEVRPVSSVTFSNVSPFPETGVQIRVVGY